MLVIRKTRVLPVTIGTPVHVTAFPEVCLPWYTLPEPKAPAATPGVPSTCPEYGKPLVVLATPGCGSSISSRASESIVTGLVRRLVTLTFRNNVKLTDADVAGARGLGVETINTSPV